MKSSVVLPVGAEIPAGKARLTLRLKPQKADRLPVAPHQGPTDRERRWRESDRTCEARSPSREHNRHVVPAQPRRNRYAQRSNRKPQPALPAAGTGLRKVALIAGLGILFSLGQSQWRNIETNDTGVWRCHRDCPHIVAKPASRNQNVAGERAVSSHPGKQRRCRRPFLPRHFANSVEFVPVGHVIGYRLQDVVKTSVTLSEVLGFLFIASLIRSGPFRFVW
jgi:hypothetical protein